MNIGSFSSKLKLKIRREKQPTERGERAVLLFFFFERKKMEKKMEEEKRKRGEEKKNSFVK